MTELHLDLGRRKLLGRHNRSLSIIGRPVHQLKNRIGRLFRHLRDEPFRLPSYRSSNSSLINRSSNRRRLLSAQQLLTWPLLRLWFEPQWRGGFRTHHLVHLPKLFERTLALVCTELCPRLVAIRGPQPTHCSDASRSFCSEMRQRQHVAKTVVARAHSSSEREVGKRAAHLAWRGELRPVSGPAATAVGLVATSLVAQLVQARAASHGGGCVVAPLGCGSEHAVPPSVLNLVSRQAVSGASSRQGPAVQRTRACTRAPCVQCIRVRGARSCRCG